MVYLTMPTRPLLFVCTPPPLFSTRPVFHILPHVVNVRFPVVIPEIAAVAAEEAKKKEKVRKWVMQSCSHPTRHTLVSISHYFTPPDTLSSSSRSTSNN